MVFTAIPMVQSHSSSSSQMKRNISFSDTLSFGSDPMVRSHRTSTSFADAMGSSPSHVVRSPLNSQTFTDPLALCSNQMDRRCRRSSASPDYLASDSRHMIQRHRNTASRRYSSDSHGSSRSRSSVTDTEGSTLVTCIFPKFKVKVPDELLASADDKAIRAWVWSRCQDSLQQAMSFQTSSASGSAHPHGAAYSLVEEDDDDDLSMATSVQSKTSQRSRASQQSRGSQYVSDC